MNSKSPKQTRRRRPVTRPPFAAAKKTSSRRIRRYDLGLPFGRQFSFIIRKFRTSPKNDFKHRQWIIEIENSTIREVAFVISRRKSTKRQKTTTAPFLYLPKATTAAATFLIVAGIAGAIFFGVNLHKSAKFDIAASSQKVLAAPQSTRVMSRSEPVELQIPKIGVDNKLSQVGIQSNGQMEMPWDIETAAWYKYSPTPGELGPSVIVGHLDGANFANMTGVFYRLRELAPGDEFTVTRADGTMAKFKVLYLKQVPQNNFPTQEIYGNINYAGIRLITCGGTFDTNSNHYTDNTVVFGALE